MDYQRAFAIGAAGMAVERARVEATALNLANAHTVQAAGENGYQPVRAVVKAPMFSSLLEADPVLSSLPQVSLESLATPPRRVHEPGHPAADAAGFVSYPAVDPATEMMTLMSATRAYEANVAAMNTARSLALKTLEIGRST